MSSAIEKWADGPKSTIVVATTTADRELSILKIDHLDSLPLRWFLYRGFHSCCRNDPENPEFGSLQLIFELKTGITTSFPQTFFPAFLGFSRK